MARLTPRITPFVPKPKYYTPSHVVKGKIRGLATGNAPIHVRIAVPKVPGISAAKSQAPKIKTMLTQTHTGRPPAANPKPKTPAQQTGTPTRPTTQTVRAPRSMAAKRPGVHTIQGAKMKIHKASPFKIPKIKVP